MITNTTHIALPQPPMSWRRKMSLRTMITIQIHATQAKKISIVPMSSRNG